MRPDDARLADEGPLGFVPRPNARSLLWSSGRWSILLRGSVVLILWWVLAPAIARAADDLLLDLKVAYIYNFTRFIQWPEATADRPFVIGVIGDPVMEEKLRVLEREGRRVGGRPIEVRGDPTLDHAGSCEILFVGGGARGRLPEIVRRTEGAPILLVGDTPGFAGRGVAIELFTKPDIFREAERLRFRIDPAALQGRGLVVSAQLYDVAEIVQ